MIKSKIRTVIADDEPEALEGLSNMLKDYDEIELIAQFSNGLEAWEYLKSINVDLAILDIQMPGISGIDILKNLPNPRPAILFITAYDEFAIKAFEEHAIDYILKPFTNERLEKAINHAIKNVLLKRESLNSDIQKKNFSSKKELFEANDGQLLLKVDGKIIVLNYTDVFWLEAFDYYVKVHTEKSFYLIRSTLKKMALQLPETDFIRVHNNSIVNLKKIETIDKKAGEWTLTLKGGITRNISRTYKSGVKDFLKNG